MHIVALSLRGRLNRALWRLYRAWALARHADEVRHDEGRDNAVRARRAP
jgi:hypothetical protein